MKKRVCGTCRFWWNLHFYCPIYHIQSLEDSYCTMFWSEKDGDVDD